MKRLLFLPFLLLSLALCAEQLTFTVKSYNSVTVAGYGADEVVASYIQRQNTPYKERLTAGDTAYLRIDNLPEAVLQKATVTMRSNKAAGAGSLCLAVDGRPVWQIPDCKFSSKAWNGAFTDTYVPIATTFSAQSGVVELTIIASANSLYFQSLTLQFAVVPPAPHTLTFRYGTGETTLLTEKAIGAGVLLPAIPFVNAEWQALGWLERPIEPQVERPDYLLPGSRVYPKHDADYYALYVNARELPTWVQDSSFSDGAYLVATAPPFHHCFGGKTTSTSVPAAECSLQPSDSGYTFQSDYVPASLRYSLFFEGDSVLIYHPSTRSYIGHTTKGLSVSASRWAWRPALHGTMAIYFTSATHDQLCLLPKGDAFGLFPLPSNLPEAIPHLVLFSVDDVPTAPSALSFVYTSWPLRGVGFPTISTPARGTLILQGGQLLIQAEEGVYTLGGQAVR